MSDQRVITVNESTAEEIESKSFQRQFIEWTSVLQTASMLPFFYSVSLYLSPPVGYRIAVVKPSVRCNCNWTAANMLSEALYLFLSADSSSPLLI